LGDDWRDLGQLDPLGQADDLGRQVRSQRASTAGAVTRAMRDHLIRGLADHPTVPLMTRFGAAGLGLLAPLLAIHGRRLGGGA
jgi:hypothetical protein